MRMIPLLEPWRLARRGRMPVIYDDPNCPARYRASQAPVVGSAEDVYRVKESAFFNRYIENAVKHTREAEIAGDQGNAPEMVQHANLALAQAKQAQRAGNVPGLNEGVIELKEALNGSLRNDRTASDSPTRCTSRTDANGNVIYDAPACRSQYDQSRSSLQDTTAHVREARVRLSEAAGMRPIDTRAPRTMGTNQNPRVGAP